MKILVVGVTGALGFRIGEGLVRQGHKVCGLVRASSGKVGELQRAGIEVIQGDLRDADSLDAACRGMEVVVSTATAIISAGSGNSLAAVDRAGYRSLIAAAAKNGVKKFIYVSVSPNLAATSAPLVGCKREIEQAIRSSGMKWTILQPSCFMEIWLGPPLGWSLREGRAQIFGAGSAPVSWISLEDVAACGIASVMEPKSDNQDIPLGGPEALSPGAVVQIFERLSGRKFTVKKIPGFVPGIASVIMRPFNPKLASLMGLGAQSLRGDVIDLTKARQIYGPPAISIADFWQKQLLG